MIPKIIHYCWFGNKPIPDNINKYIDSWKKYCTDFEFICWSDSNFDVNMSNFTKQAYEKGYYAFVSDYVRYYALYTYGGIYLDVDMELLRPLDKFLEDDYFMGWENKKRDICLATCIVGSIPNHMCCKVILDFYNKLDFINKESFNTTPNTVYITGIITENFTDVCLGEEYENEGLHIYPGDYFHPYNLTTGKLTITKNTYAIHHHASLWISKSSRFIKFIRIHIIAPVLGEEKYSEISHKIKKCLKK